MLSNGDQCWMFKSCFFGFLWAVLNFVPQVLAVFIYPVFPFQMTLVAIAIFLWTLEFSWTVFVLRGAELPSKAELISRLFIFVVLLLICLIEFGFVFIWSWNLNVRFLTISVISLLLESSLCIHYALYPHGVFKISCIWSLVPSPNRRTAEEAAPNRARAAQSAANLRSERLLGQPEQCPICMDRPVDRITPCGHKFCSQCLDVTRECPLCRRNIDDSSPLQLYVNV